MPLVEQELSTLPEHMISSLVLLLILSKYMSSHFNIRVQTMSVSSLLFFLLGFIFQSYHLYFNIYWCPTRFPNQKMFVSLVVTRSVSLVEQEAIIRPEHLRLVRFGVAKSLVSCVVCRILCFQGQLHCVSFELRFLIIPLVSSNHSYIRHNPVFRFLHLCDVLLYRSHLLIDEYPQFQILKEPQSIEVKYIKYIYISFALD